MTEHKQQQGTTGGRARRDAVLAAIKGTMRCHHIDVAELVDVPRPVPVAAVVVAAQPVAAAPVAPRAMHLMRPADRNSRKPPAKLPALLPPDVAPVVVKPVQHIRAAESIAPPAGKVSRRAEVTVTMPAHVQVQHCPGAERDTRYHVDPATFAGGESMAEWQRLRMRRTRKAGSKTPVAA
jgi:hypothetical protein